MRNVGLRHPQRRPRAGHHLGAQPVHARPDHQVHRQREREAARPPRPGPNGSSRKRPRSQRRATSTSALVAAPARLSTASTSGGRVPSSAAAASRDSRCARLGAHSPGYPARRGRIAATTRHTSAVPTPSRRAIDSHGSSRTPYRSTSDTRWTAMRRSPADSDGAMSRRTSSRVQRGAATSRRLGVWSTAPRHRHSPRQTTRPQPGHDGRSASSSAGLAASSASSRAARSTTGSGSSSLTSSWVGLSRCSMRTPTCIAMSTASWCRRRTGDRSRRTALRAIPTRTNRRSPRPVEIGPATWTRRAARGEAPPDTERDRHARSGSGHVRGRRDRDGHLRRAGARGVPGQPEADEPQRWGNLAPLRATAPLRRRNQRHRHGRAPARRAERGGTGTVPRLTREPGRRGSQELRWLRHGQGAHRRAEERRCCGAADGRCGAAGPRRRCRRVPRQGSGTGRRFEGQGMAGLGVEGLSGEDREFEIAKAFTRFASAAARQAARAPAGAPPQAVARAAAITAARRYAPPMLDWLGGDRGRQSEFESDEFESGSYESGSYESESYESESYESDEFESEMEAAAELLEVTSEEELEQFLGSLIKKAASTVGKVVRSPVGQALGGALKGIARRALPMVGGAVGSFVAPGRAPRSDPRSVRPRPGCSSSSSSRWTSRRPSSRWPAGSCGSRTRPRSRPLAHPGVRPRRPSPGPRSAPPRAVTRPDSDQAVRAGRTARMGRAVRSVGGPTPRAATASSSPRAATAAQRLPTRTTTATAAGTAARRPAATRADGSGR